MQLPLLVLFAPILAFAAPNSCHVSAQSPLRWLSNSIISRIWPLKNSQSSATQHGDCGRVKDQPQTAKLYSEDIVLRFNVSTAEEVQAIAEAVEEYYLDIWEFTDNWVDIRLAQNFVSISNIISLRRADNITSFLHYSMSFHPLYESLMRP
jgi:extracellular matrix protein 14